MAKVFVNGIGLKKVMDLGMKLFPNSEITETEVNDMWNELDPPINELENNWKYSLDKPNTVVTLEQYIGTDPVVTVKSSYDKDDTTYNTAIKSNDDNSEDYMFSGNDTVETVDFEEGVSMGSNIDKMFKNCINLKSVNLGNVDLSNVTSVDGTFSGTTNLEKVTEDVNNGLSDTMDKSNMFTNSGISDTTQTASGLEIEVGAESELSKWNYTLDDTNNTVTLNQYTNTTDTSAIIYGIYKKSNKKYRTRIKSQPYGPLSDYMFYGKSNLLSISIKPGIDMSNCTGIPGMFYKCSKLISINGLEYLDISNITTLEALFQDCGKLADAKGIENWNTSKVKDMSNMFDNCDSLIEIDLSKWDTTNVTDMSSMFASCSVNPLIIKGIENWNVSNVTSISAMFQNCSKMTSLDVSKWDTSKVTNMSYLFSNCYEMNLKGIETWNTSKVTKMTSIFSYCYTLTSLDLSNWNTSNVTNMNELFNGCKNLKEVKVSRSKWKVPSTATNMFKNCGCSEVTYVD